MFVIQVYHEKNSCQATKRLRRTPESLKNIFYFINNPTINKATIFATLIIGLMAGPAVSLYGSPTVSPVIAAWWAKEPLPP